MRHFKGQGGCCGGGGDYRPKKKKLAKVIQVRRSQVEGIHCQKCSDRVMEAINDIPHVAVPLPMGALMVGIFQFSFWLSAKNALDRLEKMLR